MLAKSIGRRQRQNGLTLAKSRGPNSKLRDSDTCSQSRHDDDNRKLHRPLKCNSIKVSLHPMADLFHVGLELLQSEADENINGRQES
jgi:hypothetical protein